jgi:hypothetical protein
MHAGKAGIWKTSRRNTKLKVLTRSWQPHVSFLSVVLGGGGEGFHEYPKKEWEKRALKTKRSKK